MTVTYEHPNVGALWDNQSAPGRCVNTNRGLTTRPEEAGSIWLLPRIGHSTPLTSTVSICRNACGRASCGSCKSTANAGDGSAAPVSAMGTSRSGTAPVLSNSPTGSSMSMLSRPSLRGCSSTTFVASQTAAAPTTSKWSPALRTCAAVTLLDANARRSGWQRLATGATVPFVRKRRFAAFDEPALEHSGTEAPWPVDPNYDARACEKSGINDAHAIGFIISQREADRIASEVVLGDHRKGRVARETLKEAMGE